MRPVKVALTTMNHDEDVVLLFASALADRLNDDLAAVGVAMCWALFMHDLARGESGFGKKPLPPGLLGYPTPMYAVLSMTVKQMLLDALPDDAARAEVTQAFDAMANATQPAQP